MNITYHTYDEILKKLNNGDKRKSHNPIPYDALCLNELRRLSTQEVLDFINNVGSIRNKSDIRVMFRHGYGFSWSQLRVVAEYYGFVCDSGNRRKVHYVLPGEQDSSRKEQ